MGAVVEEDFVRLADPFRRELLAHCYRMMGSVHDAEDLVQETYLKAWRAYDDFEGRSSMRTWLYRIATNTALNALESRNRRPLPTGLGGPSDQPEGDLAERSEVTWLEPYPDAMLDTSDPERAVTDRESVRLAFVAALQHLPPRQRVVLVLREVLKWKAAEVAELLGTSTAAVNSALQRARAQLNSVHPSEESVTEPSDTDSKALLARYAAAFENNDMDELLAVLKQDAVWEMPPHLEWYVGGTNVVRLIRSQCPFGPGDVRMVPVSANGQPAFALYARDDDGAFRAYQVQVLSLDGDAVSHVVAFFDTSLFAPFGLPDVHPAPATTAVRA